MEQFRAGISTTLSTLFQVYLTAGKSFDMEKKLRQIEQRAKNNYTGFLTDSELSELEDQLAATAAKVHNTESEVSCFEINPPHRLYVHMKVIYSIYILYLIYIYIINVTFNLISC